MAVLPYSAANFNDIFAEGGRGDLVDDPRLRSARARNVHAGELYALVAPIIATRTTAFWEEFCDSHDIPAGVVRTLDSLAQGQPSATHPRYGEYRQIVSPVLFSGTPAGVRRHAPDLGEQSREIMREVGIDEATIREMVDQGALRVALPK
jgi:crotonobetainyl-CoA:carnitine CoA-transferase CaiB-like acyl-CoA transferase